MMRFGIVQRLMLVAMAFAIVLLGAAALSYVRLQEVVTLAERSESNHAPQISTVADIELNVTRVSLQLRHAMLARTPEERQAAIDDVGAKRKAIDQSLEAYQARLLSDDSKQRFEPVHGLVRTFWQHGTGTLDLIKQDRREEAFAHLVSHTIPARNTLLQVLGETVRFQHQALSSEIQEIKHSISTLLTVLLTIFAVLVCGLIAFAFSMRRTLKQRVRQAQHIAERVRDGDLSTDVVDSARDEFSPLIAVLREMQTSLVRIVSEVRNGAQSVATASAEIAQGNQDLSTRTEHQASALEQTSATMDELAKTVRGNADHAQQAHRLAEEAASVAVQGGDIVGNVVQTMQGITDSSRKIADIITVIDSIAFQTNILALNAAVEAARAGEQGRGFAVVASEVRSLAQRSAEAAREIKSLIADSVNKVEQGSALVHNAGDTMHNIVEAITRVNQIVREINDASQQQSDGIGQVGSAVEEIDKVTQQNAALVEQSAAAAENMRTHADELVQAVATFRLSGDAGRAAVVEAVA